MSTYSNQLQPPKPITTCCSVLSPEIIMPDAYICGRLRQTKITRKASDLAKYIELFGYFIRGRHARRRIYRRTFLENNIKCDVHDNLGWKNRTTRYILPHRWLYEWFSQFHRCGTYSVLSRSPSFIKFWQSWGWISNKQATHLSKYRTLDMQ